MYRISVQDVTVPENKSYRYSSTLPKYIVCRLLDTLSAVTYEDHNGMPGYFFYNNYPYAYNRAVLVEFNKSHFEFIRWAIIKLRHVIKPSELVVYTIGRDIAILKIGSYLVTPLLFTGVRVLNYDEEFEALKMMITNAYSIRSLVERTRYNVEIDLNGTLTTVSVGTAQQSEGTGKFIKLLRYNGTEFIREHYGEWCTEACEKADTDTDQPLNELLTLVDEYVEGALREVEEMIEAFKYIVLILAKKEPVSLLIIKEFTTKLSTYGCLSAVVVDQILFQELDILVEQIDLCVGKTISDSKLDMNAELRACLDSDMAQNIVRKLKFFRNICFDNIE